MGTLTACSVEIQFVVAPERPAISVLECQLPLLISHASSIASLEGDPRETDRGIGRRRRPSVNRVSSPLAAVNANALVGIADSSELPAE